MEVAQKVATDTAEELKKSAAALDREIPGKHHKCLSYLKTQWTYPPNSESVMVPDFANAIA